MYGKAELHVKTKMVMKAWGRGVCVCGGGVLGDVGVDSLSTSAVGSLLTA